MSLLAEIFRRLLGGCPDQDEAVRRLAYVRQAWLDSHHRYLQWQRQMAIADLY